jgi:hypothetical protein
VHANVAIEVTLALGKPGLALAGGLRQRKVRRGPRRNVALIRPQKMQRALEPTTSAHAFGAAAATLETARRNRQCSITWVAARGVEQLPRGEPQVLPPAVPRRGEALLTERAAPAGHR